MRSDKIEILRARRNDAIEAAPDAVIQFAREFRKPDRCVEVATMLADRVRNLIFPRYNIEDALTERGVIRIIVVAAKFGVIIAAQTEEEGIAALHEIMETRDPGPALRASVALHALGYVRASPLRPAHFVHVSECCSKRNRMGVWPNERLERAALLLGLVCGGRLPPGHLFLIGEEEARPS